MPVPSPPVASGGPLLALLVVLACPGRVRRSGDLVTVARAPPLSSPTAPRPPTAAPTPTASPSPAPAFPVTLTDDEGTAITLATAPQKIVSLTPAVTETLFAVGAGDRVVATDDASDYPAEAKPLPDVVTFGTVDVEKIVSLAPDLVIAGGAGFTSAESIAQLRALKIPVLVVSSATLDQICTDIELVGTAVGETAAATALVDTMQADMTAVGTAAQAAARQPARSRASSTTSATSTPPARSTARPRARSWPRCWTCSGSTSSPATRRPTRSRSRPSSSAIRR